MAGQALLRNGVTVASVFLLFILPAAAANPTPSTSGTASFARATLSGEAVSGGPLSMAHSTAAGPGSISLQFEAASATIVETWTETPVVGLGPLLPTVKGERTTYLVDAKGQAASSRAGAEALLEATSAGYTLNRPGGTLSLSAVEHVQEGFASSSAVALEFSRADASPLITTSDGRVRLRADGDLRVHLFDIDLWVTAGAGGPRSFRSGEWTQLGLEHAQRVELRLHQATVELETSDHDVGLYATQPLVSSGHVVLETVKGRLGGGTTTTSFESSRAVFSSAAPIQLLAHASDDGQTVSASIWGDGVVLEMAKQGWVHASEAVDAASGQPITYPVTFVVLASVGIATRRRKKIQRLADEHVRSAEAALARADPRGALAASEQALRLRPHHPTGLVTRAIALVQLGRFHDGLLLAGQGRLPPSARASLAFLGAVCAERLGRTRECAEWLKRAVQADGALQPEAQRNPRFGRVRFEHAWALTNARLLPHDPALGAYA